jgi:hypothetical protein
LGAPPEETSHLCIKLTKVNRGTMLNTNIQGGPFPQFKNLAIRDWVMLEGERKRKNPKENTRKMDLQHYPIY